MTRLVAALLAVCLQAADIPKTWDDEAIASIEIPHPIREYTPVHVRSDFYYQMRVRPIYQSYPIYAPGKEPSGYIERLKQQEPAIAFDPARLRTERDWVQAGEIVFDAPLVQDTAGPFAGAGIADSLKDPAWYRQTGTPVAKDGTVPFLRYVVRKKGVLEVGLFSCGMCHTRVMPDGTVLKGAQGNFPFEAVVVGNDRRYEDKPEVMAFFRRAWRSLYATPWLRPDPIEQLTDAEVFAARTAIPPGVIARQRSTPFSPAQVPDLIGVKDRKYLDRSGVAQQRNIGDLMRYAALNQGADDVSSFGGFVPAIALRRRMAPPSAFQRYSDEQLYALALYLYSLEPPPNPNAFDAAARRGGEIFEREGCAKCHTPPLYTNNKLAPAPGFQVPEDHFRKYDVLPETIGTDPQLTMNTRRGTGYYKVPSLKGVWYRGPFEHMGSVATLEDWFDPSRLREDYVPTGFAGYAVKTRAVKGHEFGLKLSASEKRALVAFLRTL
jgi:Di-haem oxidoreductase, putative peroxidase